MGVEHYLICKKHNEYIDIHKAYEFSMVIHKDRPPVGVDCKETGFNDVVLRGGYWEARGLWFIWKHKECCALEMLTDSSDEWFDLEPYLKEVFPHTEDVKIRERKKERKK